MKYSEAIKPISYLKTHASEVIRDVAENQKTLIITQNGEAKAVVQDIKIYEQNQEAMALLKILALSSKNLAEGKVKPLEKSFKDIGSRISKLKKEAN